MFCWLTSQEETRTLHFMRLSLHYQHNTSASVTKQNKILDFWSALSVANFKPDDFIVGLWAIFTFTITDSSPHLIDMFWGKTLLVWVLCLWGRQQRNCCGDLSLLFLLRLSCPGWAMGWTQGAPCNLLHREISARLMETGIKKKAFLPQCNPCFISLNKESIEPLLLHNSHTGHRQLVVAGQTTPIRTDAGWWFQCHTAAAAWDYNSSNTTANSRPR